MSNKRQAPLYQALQDFSAKRPISFHVPGHKNGSIFSNKGKSTFNKLLSFDVTELSGLDDLHAPSGVIEQAQEMASEWFKSDYTYFLVGGSTVGNLAMILTVCAPNEKIIVQRNCHKSIMNGLELCGADPIFLSPDYDEEVNRYTFPTVNEIKKAIQLHSDAKAIVLTYPDYFGRTFELKRVVDYAHQYNIPVLIDEAHGVHFHLSDMFPSSALELGADIVVQSAHKTIPAMTMGSFLHIKSSLIEPAKVNNYLQMLQSSSPSYPIMASLDLSRHFLENLHEQDLIEINQSIKKFRKLISNSNEWTLVKHKNNIDDPLKITIKPTGSINGNNLAKLFEEQYIYPELSNHNNVLFVHGLQPLNSWDYLNNSLDKIRQQLKTTDNHATIEENKVPFNHSVTTLAYSYHNMKQKKTKIVSIKESVGFVAAEAIIPYPPGIPLVIKGEIITEEHTTTINYLLEQGTNFQNNDIENGLYVFL